jgi:hypothetical protein
MRREVNVMMKRSNYDEVVLYYKLKGKALSLKARALAFDWIRRNYDIPYEEAYKNMLDYIFGGSEDTALWISSFEMAFDKDIDEEAAYLIHEMVEASEIKRRFGKVEFQEVFRDYAHPIAVQYESRFLKDMGRKDLAGFLPEKY